MLNETLSLEIRVMSPSVQTLSGVGFETASDRVSGKSDILEERLKLAASTWYFLKKRVRNV